jgi:hemerythrin
MDDTHREFVDLVNGLLTCPESDIAERLQRFAEHSDGHFADELQWMKGTEFPATDCHADEHAAVMKSVREVQALLESGHERSIAIARDLAQELARWFPGHAGYLDASLAQWIVKKRTGGTPIVLRRGVIGG